MHAMNKLPMELILKRFDTPDEIRTMEKGTFELIHIGGMTIGRAIYEPGWKWSRDVGVALNQSHCPVEHIGLVLSGSATVAFENEPVQTVTPGDLFYVPKKPHDSWVVGDEPYVSLHFLGAEVYAK